ncbi:MAG: flexitail domain-containing putative surface protein [Dehalococcoidia bacterium]
MLALAIIVVALLALFSQGVTAQAGLSLDSDGDGCTDGEELGPSPQLGGMRDLNNPWDFFDTPPRDNSITVADILRIVVHFGTYEALPHSGYDPWFDRGPPVSGGDPWDLSEPDGAVSVGDILFTITQFGHHCDALEPPPPPPDFDALFEGMTGHTVGELEEWFELNLASRSISQHLQDGTLSIACQTENATMYALNIDPPDWGSEGTLDPDNLPTWMDDIPTGDSDPEVPPAGDCMSGALTSSQRTASSHNSCSKSAWVGMASILGIPMDTLAEARAKTWCETTNWILATIVGLIKVRLVPPFSADLLASAFHADTNIDYSYADARAHLAQGRCAAGVGVHGAIDTHGLGTQYWLDVSLSPGLYCRE